MKDGSGKVASEKSISVNFDGKDMLIPSMVPTLTQSEVDWILNGENVVGGSPTAKAIMRKAVDHARQRMAQGKPVWAE